MTPDQERRAAEYAASRERTLAHGLGSGTDGAVWKTEQATAIKVFDASKQYRMELSCYQRLGEHRIRKLGGFVVPRLVDFSEELLVVEMTVVTAPYIIDFGKAYLDTEPAFSPEVLQDHEQQQRELWGDRLGQVKMLLWQLREMGIHYMDAKPQNIAFGADDGPE